MDAWVGEYAMVLAVGAERAAAAERLRQLEVRRVHLSRAIEHWESYRRTLSNQVEVGAYAMVQLNNRSRIVWTTTHGKAETATLQRWSGRAVKVFKAATVEEMEELLLRDLQDVFTDARRDSRMRSLTARGWDVDQELSRRRQAEHFWEVAVGRERLGKGEAFDWLIWWQEMLGVELRRHYRGTPVPADVYALLPEDFRGQVISGPEIRYVTEGSYGIAGIAAEVDDADVLMGEWEPYEVPVHEDADPS